MDRQLPSPAACRIPLGAGGAGTAVPGRIGNQPCVSLALPAGGSRQSAWIRCDGSHADQRRPRRRTLLGQLRGVRAPPQPQDPPRRRAESHVGFRTQSLVGACAGAWAVQRGCRVLRFQEPTAPTLPCAFVHFGAPLWSRHRGGRTHHRDRARASTRPPLREYLAAGACLLGQAGEALADALEQGRLQDAVERTQGDKELLNAVLQRQFYLLHGWKLAGEIGNYRRFFDIGTLSGIRMESPAVFAAAHARIEAMIARDEIDGLRVDHPDGLREPLEYFKRLRALLPKGRIYVEKILENDESLKDDWPVDGSVGYEFLSKVNRLWMDDKRTDVLTSTYSDFTGHSVNFAALVREKKRAIVESTFCAEHERLTGAALEIARAEWQTRDLSPRQLREALARLIIALPVYRTYRTLNTLHDDDKRTITEAVQSARIGAPEIDAAALDFLAALFTKSRLNEAEADFVAQWQQLTPAVMAKGVEDTTFYCYDRLVSCNEVGSQASLIGISAGKFHEFCHSL